MPARIHVAEGGLNVPNELVENPTVPLGVVGDEDVSVTVALQATALFMIKLVEKHTTEVVVGRKLTTTKVNNPVLEVCMGSPV